MDRPSTVTDRDGPGSDPTELTSRSHRLRRSTTDREVAGVLGGLAERTGIDSSVLRLVVVGLTTYLAFGVEGGAQLLVVLPYAAVWATVPTDGTRSLLRQLPRRAAAQELGLMAALVLLTTWAADQPNVLLVAVLGGATALLLRDRPDTDWPDVDRPAADGLQQAGLPSADDPSLRSLDGSGGTDLFEAADPLITSSTSSTPAAPVGRRSQPRRSRPEHKPRPRREPALWPLAFGLVLVVLFGAAAVAQLDGSTADPRLVVNLFLLVVGAVMLLSAWRGRARALVLALPLLLPVWFATSAAGIGGQQRTGVHRHRPADVPSSGRLAYEVGTGVVDVDLTDLPFDRGSTTHLDVEVTLGVARVVVPANVELEITGEVGLGTVNVEDRFGGGSNRWASHQTVRWTRQPEQPPCYPTQVTESDLRNLLVSHGVSSPDPDDLVGEVERAGFDRPQLVGTVDGTDGFHYDSFGEPAVGEDLFEVHTSPWWELCKPIPPDPNPPVLAIDATVGMGSLEVRRV